VQAIVKLALKAPFELGMIEVAGMEIEEVSVHRNRWIFELDDDFDPVPLLPSGKIQQRVLEEAKLR
jgi:hypothetical protein